MGRLTMAGAKAVIPPSQFYSFTRFRQGIQVDGESSFLDRITSTQHASGREALRLVGANGLFQILQILDFLSNPIQATNTAGGDGVFGDRRSAFRPGDIFNADMQTLTQTSDNVAANAAGFLLGHGTGVNRFYSGSGAPGAAHPVTTGIPANGTFYFRNDGGTGTTLYQVRTGAWVAIL